MMTPQRKIDKKVSVTIIGIEIPLSLAETLCQQEGCSKCQQDWCLGKGEGTLCSTAYVNYTLNEIEKSRELPYG